MSDTQLSVRPITADEHRGFIASRPAASFLQRPEWAAVKREWRPEYLGFFSGDALVGSAQVLHRPLPVLRRTLAYVPEGPVLDWAAYTTAQVTEPLLAHLARGGAFLVRMGVPGVQAKWRAAEVRKALSGKKKDDAAPTPEFVTGLEPLAGDGHAALVAAQLRAAGWTKPEVSEDFAAGQPEFQARIPLRDTGGEQLDVDGVLAGMNQNARRETRKAASGPLEVQVGAVGDVERFHALYRETAERDGFTPRPASYFTTMWTELNARIPGTCTVYFAVHEGRDLAAAIRVQSGEGAWYVYGASSSAERKLFAPKALIHRMIEDSLAAGCAYLDHGGVSPTLSRDHHLAGLTLFKTTLGCDVVQTLGEWDYRLNKPLAKAFELYMNARDRH
ncbi:lipid II:glycine glycyltransferase FemX [Zhihengliuella flava]|uniref:Lipid II:glycine glycyltransferase (Peptidoglycan interpeptide bridge formation enzyme) n=1 Tax=Zhihengliuella flava TaxID=1285193 RepID=A0A931D9T8_9MICC|nr:lipid II:glycine glycyltransferase (peptidoglycan interpeptide bridge formation enzyme) [Zhihengliuella flava]